MYKSFAKERSNFTLADFIRSRYEQYKVLSKYFFCIILKDVNMQYCKLVAEQTIKEADLKIANEDIINDLKGMSKYDNSDELATVFGE